MYKSRLGLNACVDWLSVKRRVVFSSPYLNFPSPLVNSSHCHGPAEVVRIGGLVLVPKSPRSRETVKLRGGAAVARAYSLKAIRNPWTDVAFSGRCVD